MMPPASARATTPAIPTRLRLIFAKLIGSAQCTTGRLIFTAWTHSIRRGSLPAQPPADRRPPSTDRILDWSVSRRRLEVFREKTDQGQPVEPLEGRHTCAVVAARQHSQLMFNSATSELVDEHPGEIDREGQVVSRVNEQQALVSHAVQVRERRDRHPDAAQPRQIDVTIESLPDVVRREA